MVEAPELRLCENARNACEFACVYNIARFKESRGKRADVRAVHMGVFLLCAAFKIFGKRYRFVIFSVIYERGIVTLLNNVVFCFYLCGKRNERAERFIRACLKNARRFLKHCIGYNEYFNTVERVKRQF